MPELVVAKDLKILDFDIETRLVGFYEAGRFKPKGSEPIAIAASFIGSDKVDVWLQPEHSIEEMLAGFRLLYKEADIVTGHYIRKFDLPILNGAMFEYGFDLLDPMKLVSDTKTDLKPFEGLSKSQENLSELLELAESKYHMNDPRWRKATRLTPEGVKRTRSRVTGDVQQHKVLRKALLDAGVLNPPTILKP
jgi:DNA polymerase elongation subunit (family B)